MDGNLDGGGRGAGGAVVGMGGGGGMGAAAGTVPAAGVSQPVTPLSGSTGSRFNFRPLSETE